MTVTGPAATDLSVSPDEVAVERGARWVTAASLAVGAVNYGYALLLTRLLNVDDYAVFAAGQGLVLSAGAIAVVAIPWVLAQGLAGADTESQRQESIRFAILMGVLGGSLAAAVVAAVAAQFASPAAAGVLALCTLLIYVTRVPSGWLQGTERMRTLALVTTAEAALKLAAGLLLVSVLGLRETGALAAFGIAVLPFLIWWPHRTRSGPRHRPHVATNRDLWRRALAAASIQGLIALMVATDVVLITLLPAGRAAAASYQASAMVGRIPLFLAGAIAIAFFPALSRLSTVRARTPLTANAVRMYLIVALPLTAICATAPASLLTTVFPHEYARMGQLLVFTALSGFAVGALTLAASVCQAANDYACLRWQCAGLLGYIAALLVGWHTGGVIGFAVGAACGTLAAAALLIVRVVRRQGVSVLARAPLAEPLLLCVVLIALRPVPKLWLVAATAIGVHAAARFLRHHGAPPRGPTGSGRARGTEEADAVRLLVDAVWRGKPRPAGDDQLRRALAVARANQVEGLLARAYPGQLAAVLAEVDGSTELFRRNLTHVTDRLRRAGIPAVLIKADLNGDYVYGNFDLVVPSGQWRAAEAALSDWYVSRSTYWLERSTKVLLASPRGPAAHLHSAVSWFGVPVVPNDRLFARAVPCDGHSWLTPGPADRLRIWLAHGLFQNLTLDLSELLAVRELLRPDVVAEARREAAREGWPAGSRGALSAVAEAIDRLDHGRPVRLPHPLPVSTALHVGAEHTCHLLRQGRAVTAAREAALRVPLVLAKKLRTVTP